MTDPTHSEPEPPETALVTEPDLVEASLMPTSETYERFQEEVPLPIAVACKQCPAALWFRSTNGVKTYCHIMHSLTYDSKEPETYVTHCDEKMRQEREARAGKAEADGASDYDDN